MLSFVDMESMLVNFGDVLVLHIHLALLLNLDKSLFCIISYTSSMKSLLFPSLSYFFQQKILIVQLYHMKQRCLEDVLHWLYVSPFE